MSLNKNVLVSDLNEYKKAKIICNDLHKLNSLLTTYLKELKFFNKYLPVNYIFNEILTQKAMIDIHYKKYKQILDNKGNINED